MLTREQIERHRQTYFTSLRISPEEWNALCDQAIKAIPADLLDDLIEYFDQRADVVDGSYGEPHPNREMQILQRLKELPAEQVPATPFLHSGDSGAATPARAGEPRCAALQMKDESFYCIVCNASLPITGKCWKGRTQA